MSSFKDYDSASRHYDVTRIPIGIEIITGCLARHSRPLDELVLLDAGCGTGAYSAALVDLVGRIDAIDLSPGMLKAARDKLAKQAAAGRIVFHQGSITDLPFDADSFDAVMTNQVVHHLGDHAEGRFDALRGVIGEFARVLRRGGTLLINYCSQDQLRRGYWYHALIPEAADVFRSRFAPCELVEAILRDTGFAPEGRLVPIDEVCQGEAYLDGTGPLRESWRDGDSVWSEASAEELTRALDRVRELQTAGGLDAFVAEHDAERPKVGQITILHARLAS